MKKENLNIIEKAETIFSMVDSNLVNYPKFEKHGLCKDIRRSYANLIKNLMMANKVKSKRYFYQEEADGHLQVCKIFNNLSFSRKHISEGFYEDISLKLTELGKDLSSWIKSN